MTYVFDIDGTICSSIIPGEDYNSAIPLQKRIDIVNKLFDEGHTIIFQTARGMGRSKNSVAYAHSAFYSMTKQQLESWGVKFHGLFLGKPAADIYVDDKGHRDIDFFLRYLED
jgi:hypothetical protein